MGKGYQILRAEVEKISFSEWYARCYSRWYYWYTLNDVPDDDISVVMILIKMMVIIIIIIIIIIIMSVMMIMHNYVDASDHDSNDDNYQTMND